MLFNGQVHEPRPAVQLSHDPQEHLFAVRALDLDDITASVRDTKAGTPSAVHRVQGHAHAFKACRIKVQRHLRFRQNFRQ